MGVALLEIAKSADELFARDVFVVGKEISLSGLASVVDEDVGIGRHTSDGTDHVTASGWLAAEEFGEGECSFVRTYSLRT